MCNPDSSRQAGFATTRWSQVASAREGSSSESREALESLCRTYWFPLYAYARPRVADRGEAQDLTQAFFAELLERDMLDTADPERGRFRAFLLAAFKHFCSKQWQRAKAQKRGGGQRGLSLDFSAGDSRLQIEPSTDVTADQLYEQQWALTLLEQVLTRLEDEHRHSGKERQFECLKGFLIGDHPDLTFSDAAAALETTEAAARMATHRMRLRYRSLLREEIGHTVSGPEEIDEEIRRLFQTLGGGNESPHP